MSNTFSKHPALRWAVPVAALAVVATPVGLGSAQAKGGLPPKTAEQLLVAVQQSRVEQYQGTVQATVDLGLGQLASMAGRSTDFQNLADGTNTLRVWADGTQRQRVALLGEGGEADIVRNGRELWAWNAQQQTAEHSTLPAHQNGSHAAAAQQMPTPQEAARQVLAALDRTTEVTTSGFATVAGRDAYSLTLTPRTDATLVKNVVIAIDGATSMPLRVSITAKGASKPSVDVGFSSLDLTAPPASVFTFTPPKGATVTQHDAAPHATTRHQPTSDAEKKAAEQRAARSMVRIGQGWSTVVVAKLPADALPGAATQPKDASAAQLGQLLEALPTRSGAWGSGKFFEGSLFTVVLSSDGRVAAGPVPAAQLEKALASPAARRLVAVK